MTPSPTWPDEDVPTVLARVTVEQGVAVGRVVRRYLEGTGPKPERELYHHAVYEVDGKRRPDTGARLGEGERIYYRRPSTPSANATRAELVSAGFDAAREDRPYADEWETGAPVATGRRRSYVDVWRY